MLVYYWCKRPWLKMKFLWSNGVFALFLEALVWKKSRDVFWDLFTLFASTWSPTSKLFFCNYSLAHIYTSWAFFSQICWCEGISHLLFFIFLWIMKAKFYIKKNLDCTFYLFWYKIKSYLSSSIFVLTRALMLKKVKVVKNSNSIDLNN